MLQCSCVDDTLYFSADDGIHGTELWAYDMTTDTTRMVADIYPGSNASFPGYWLAMNTMDVIYFDASDPITDVNCGHTTP